MSNPFTQSMVKMQGPAGGGTSIACRGFTMDLDKDGTVTVPGDVARELESHGFTKAPDAPPKK